MASPQQTDEKFDEIYNELASISSTYRQDITGSAQASFSSGDKFGLSHPSKVISDSISRLLQEIDAIKQAEESAQTTVRLTAIMLKAKNIINGTVTQQELEQYTQSLPKTFGANKTNHGKNLAYALIAISAAIVLASIATLIFASGAALALAGNPFALGLALGCLEALTGTIGAFLLNKFNTIQHGKTVAPAIAVKHSLFTLFNARSALDKNEFIKTKKTQPSLLHRVAAAVA